MGEKNWSIEGWEGVFLFIPFPSVFDVEDNEDVDDAVPFESSGAVAGPSADESGLGDLVGEKKEERELEEGEGRGRKEWAMRAMREQGKTSFLPLTISSACLAISSTLFLHPLSFLGEGVLAGEDDEEEGPFPRSMGPDTDLLFLFAPGPSPFLVYTTVCSLVSLCSDCKGG